MIQFCKYSTSMFFFLLRSFCPFICFYLSDLDFFINALSSSYRLFAIYSFFLFSRFSIYISRSFFKFYDFICINSFTLSAFHLRCFSLSSFICFIKTTFCVFILSISLSRVFIFTFCVELYFCIAYCSLSFYLARLSLSSRSLSFLL